MALKKAEEALKIASIRDLLACNSNYIIGIDEVGTGAWAGPIIVGAVVLPSDWANPRVRDSKQYKDSRRYKSHEIRSMVYSEVLKRVILHAETGLGSATDVDEYGLNVVLDSLVLELAVRARNKYPDAILVVDGDRLPRGVGPAIALPKADSIVPAVSAASILAKIKRDTIMHNLAELYPEYGFDRGVGYGTKHHEAGILRVGLCPEHRRSYRSIERLGNRWEYLRRKKEMPGLMS